MIPLLGEGTRMKKTLSAKQLFLIALAICGGYAYLVFSSTAIPEKDRPHISVASAEAITRRCAVEAGIDPDKKGHKVTPEEMRALESCTDRHTKQYDK
jgi:hypothetical protein